MADFERELFAQGIRLIVGVDEVGRGPLAGPVVAGAVILDPADPIEGIDDSKKLTARERERLAGEIRRRALAWAVAYVDEVEIDRINIYQASKRAMLQAIARLAIRPEHILSDAMPLREAGIPFTAIIHGDALSPSIGAASIVAKVERDAFMTLRDADYPGYGFARNKGYPTPEHLAALRRLGPTPIHRRSYAPVRACNYRQEILEVETEVRR